MNQHDLKAAEIVRNALEVRKPRNGHHPGKPDPVAVAAGALTLAPAIENAQKQAAEDRANEQALQEAVGDRIRQLQLMALRGLLQEQHAAGAIDTADVETLERAGALQGFADAAGNRWFELRGQLLVTFYPPEAAIDSDAGLLVNMRMRVPT